MSAIPREILKWIQTLDLSYSVKNYRRDFANGFLIAQIISKYRPHDIQLHSFDTGTGPAARRNNWELLEKIFNKLDIPVSKVIIKDVSSYQQDGAITLLLILNSRFVKKRQPNNISVEKVGNVVAESVQLQNNKEPPQESPKKHNTGPVHPQELTNALNKLISKASISADSTSSEIVYNNPRLVNDGHPLAESESEKPAHEVDNKTWDDNMGKVAISRYITVSVLGCTEAPSALFSRSSYHIIAIRDHIMQRIQSLPTSAGIHEIGAAIKSKEADIVNILKHSLPSDIILFLDTFLQLLIVSDEKTILFRVVVLTLSHVGQFLHQAMASTTTSSNSHTPSFMNGGTTSPFQRLINTKELGYVFLHLQSIPTNGKVFGVAKIIMSFFENALPISGYEISENERVGGLLAIKSMMNSAQKLSDARMQPSSTTVSNAAFIILLSVILHIEDESKLRKSRNQLCTLYLSESLTVINSNKRYLTNTMPIASNRQSSGLIELVITETCAAFHILAHLAHCGKRSVSAIAPDNDCILKEFAMAKANRTSAASKVLNSTPLILSCCRLISNLLKLNHIPNDPHFEEAACLLLDVMEEDTLFPAMYMLGPYLEEHPRISTYFVKALINLDPVERIRALQQVSFVKNRSQLEATATTAKMKMEIKWGLPFLPSELVMIYTKINHTSWHPYSVGMGLVNLIQKSGLNSLSKSHMEIFAYLAELIMERIASSSSSTNLSGKQPSIDFKKWRLVFSQVKELILVALTQAECVRHSVSCLKVMAKLKLFEDTKTCHSLLLTVLYIFNRSPGPHSRNQMKQLLLDWTTQSSPNDNRTSSEPLLNLLIDDGALRSQFNMVVGDGIGGGGTRQIFTNPDDAAVLALAAEPVEENNNHVHSRKDASLSSSEGDNPPSIQISDVEYWDAGFSKRIKSVLNLLVKTFPQTSSKNADLNELILSCLS